MAARTTSTEAQINKLLGQVRRGVGARSWARAGRARGAPLRTLAARRPVHDRCAAPHAPHELRLPSPPRQIYELEQALASAGGDAGAQQLLQARM